MPWQFWLDVGGTFTDCLARAPDGNLLRRKVLSSAITKGRANVGRSGPERPESPDARQFQITVHDPLRTEPANFWTNYTLRLLNGNGETLLKTPIIESSTDGRMKIGDNLQFAISNLQFASTSHSALRNPQFSYELLSPEEAPLLAIRLFLGLRLDDSLPPCTVRVGTTRGTNALLTRRGAKTAFVTTRGFADILRIGYQNRPKLFELAIKKPEPLFTATAEIDERIAADGSVLQAPSEAQIQSELVRLKAAGSESLAICLLNSYANPSHEQQIENLARAAGFAEISLSHRASPLMKIVPRGDTTVVDAYLNPILKTYIDRLSHFFCPSVPPSPPLPISFSPPPASTDLRLMTSAGGLASPDSFTGKDSLLSGPAGGVVGFSRAAEAAGFQKAIGFDMGGTSTDVSRYDGRFEYEFETEKAGVRIVAPMLAIETIAAGGGSICRFDGVKLIVGPNSAGADPGPACYGRGGPLTVTDCNLLLGRIVPDHFAFTLDRQAAENRLSEIASQIEAASKSQFAIRNLQSSPTPQSPTTHASPLTPHSALAGGFLRIANANMAAAIRSISLAKGYDPRDYCLVAFGAAAPQHACAVAAELGITKILIHPDAGVLSALGIGLADVIKHRTAGIYKSLTDGRVGQASEASAGQPNPKSKIQNPKSSAATQHSLEEVFTALETQARSDVASEGIPQSRIETRRFLDLRYQGADAPLTIPQPADNDYAAVFTIEHRRLYGYVHENRPLEILAARIEAIGRSETRLEPSHRLDPISSEPHRSHQLINNGASCSAALYHREKLPPGTLITGPAVILEPLTTTVLDPGWQATVLSGGELLIEAATAHSNPNPAPALTPLPTPGLTLNPSPSSAATAPDPILLELFNNHLTAIATQMGITLKSTSMSVNVKERLDFSCAIFTERGDLVVNAPHIPVHLGAMSQTVKQTIAENPAMQPGDVFITNDPYRGGSHLPDITVITPVFLPPLITHGSPLTPVFFTASRAHHAEIGGITPGSMPPFSKNLAEEGVLIQNFKLLDAGQSRFDELRALLISGPYPSRSPDTNIADITAQVAANHQGAEDLRRMVQQYSLPVVQAYMRHIQDAAERKTRAALSKLPPGRREFTDHLDDGTPIHVAITIHPQRESAIAPAGPSLNPDPAPTRLPAPSLTPARSTTHDSLLTTRWPAATIDFTVTGPIHPGNLNANPSIVTAAVIYVLRLLINEPIPLNQGVLNAVELIIPPGLLNPLPEPRLPTPDSRSLPAVVGGNVETSQRVVDVLLGAFGLAAASQGTMNNLLFGDETFGYYETICGGSGATADSNGADAVHTHMTNTRLTDPEVLEARYPVRLREFSIRRGSGGAGQRRGGDGVMRRLEFLKPLTLSILSQRRGIYSPNGVDGGKSGTIGSNTLRRADGTIEQLAALAQTQVQPGDELTIQTPGGGGWGKE